jgi:hypothetical protein
LTAAGLRQHQNIDYKLIETGSGSVVKSPFLGLTPQ